MELFPNYRVFIDYNKVGCMFTEQITRPNGFEVIIMTAIITGKGD